MQMPEFKNIIYQSAIYAQGNVHIGDKYIIQGVETKISTTLNTIPFIAAEDVIGRETERSQLHQFLDDTDRVTLLNGIGGIGKTTLAKYFVNYYRTDFAYIAWIDNLGTIKESFINNAQLIDSLHLRDEINQIKESERWIDECFDLIINRMRQLGGDNPDKSNLLIIDNAGEDIEHSKTLDHIRLRPNWKVLVTSREKLIGFFEYELSFLSPNDATRLFYYHYKREENAALVASILQLIDYHTLLIEVIAKTAQSLRLSLEDVLNRLKKKGLHISLKDGIKFQHNYNESVRNVINYLLTIFDLSAMSPQEIWISQQFSVLPSMAFIYHNEEKDNILKLLRIHHDERRDDFTIALTRLVEKGWLKWDVKEDSFKMHNLIQEVVRLNFPPDVDSCSDLIQELNSRMSYQKVDWLSTNNIIVQHLIKYIVGNSETFAELLDEYASVLLRPGKYFESIEIQKRALEMKEKVLPPNHLKLADSFNSLALAYKNLDQYDVALTYQLKDLEITKLHTEEEDYNIAITYNNLSLIYRKINDFEKANYYQEAAIRIAQKINDEDLNSVVYNNYGNLAYIQKDYQTALEQFQISLAIRQLNHSDPLWISEAHYNLGTVYIEIGRYAEAKEQLDLAFDIEKQLVPEAPSFAIILYGYGLYHAGLQEYHKAIAYFSQSMAVYSQSLPDNHSEIVRVKNWIKTMESHISPNDN